MGSRGGGIVDFVVVEMSERTGTWDLAEGEELAPGRYAVRRLGVSNVHEVYVAWDESLLGLVAAKVLRRDRLEDRDALKALAGEAVLLGSLQHPSLPRCFDARMDAERPHLALELIEGPRVSTVIRRQRVLALEQVVPLALQICSVLHYLAGKGLVHLDIKPKNVIMAPPPRVIDLSIARTVQGEPAATGWWREHRPGEQGRPVRPSLTGHVSGRADVQHARHRAGRRGRP